MSRATNFLGLGSCSSPAMANTGIERRRSVRDRGRRTVVRDPAIEDLADDQRSDAQVAAAVQAALTCDVFVPSSITAKVRDGHVTLEGEVIWKFQRRMAEHAVRTLAGVVAVHDGIKLTSETTASQVKARVRASLKRKRTRATG